MYFWVLKPAIHFFASSTVLSHYTLIVFINGGNRLYKKTKKAFFIIFGLNTPKNIRTHFNLKSFFYRWPVLFLMETTKTSFVFIILGSRKCSCAMLK